MNNFVIHTSIGRKGGYAVSELDGVCELFAQGDANAVSTLVETYQNELYSLCFRLTFNRQDADDLFQQTWLKAMRSATGYRNGAFRPWLFRICLNQYRDNYRRMMRRRRLLKEDFRTTGIKDFILGTVDSPDSPEEQVERKHIQALLVAHIDRLPPGQKLPVILFYYQRMKYADIAAALGIPVGTVKSRINTAKRKLKTELEGELYV